MLKKIKKFLLDYKIADESILYVLEDSVLQSTPILSADKSQVILKFLLHKCLEPSAFFKIFNKLKTIKDIEINVLFEIENDNYNETAIINYLNYYFSDVLNNKSSLIKIINRPEFCFLQNKKITLNFNNNLEKETFEPYLNFIQQFFKEAGFKDLEINLNVLIQTAEVQLHRQQLEKKYSKTIIYDHSNTQLKRIIDLNKISSNSITKIQQINYEESRVIVCGQIFDIQEISGRRGTIYEFSVTDFSDSLAFTIFPRDTGNLPENYIKSFKNGDWVKIEGSVNINKYRRNELSGIVSKILKIQPFASYERFDKSEEKRNELIFHSKMTSFDGITSVSDYLSFVNNLGWTNTAITDTYGVQAYPEANLNSKSVNLIYGLDCDLIEDKIKVTLNDNVDLSLEDATYVIFDLETTGLYPHYHEIIEFGAIKVKNNRIIDQIDFFIKPKKAIPDKISSITNITNDMVKDACNIKEALKKIKNWIKDDDVLVAHNGIDFDFKFLQTKLALNKLELLNNPMIDTLRISWAINDNYSYHSLGSIARKLNIDYDEEIAHRADVDAEVLKNVFSEFKSNLEERGILNIKDLNANLQTTSLKTRYRGNKCLIYAKNQKGLKAIYEVVSKSLTTNYLSKPKIFWSDLAKYRKDIFVSCSPNEGQVFNAALYGDDNFLQTAISYYDFILISPPHWNDHLINSGNLTLAEVEDVLKRIIANSKSQNKKVIATSDAYYLHPWEKPYHELMIHVKALGGKRHRFYRYNSLEQYGPSAHLRTTDEMLHEFKFLRDQNLSKEIVIDNVKDILSKFDSKKIEPIKKGLHPPKIKDADSKLQELTWKTAKKIYGENMPNLIKERIEEELNSILLNGYGVIYWIAHLLVERSNKEGYLVGSRGSVGSSLVATLTGISEINPLPPHYICNSCYLVEFVDNVDDGYDLVNKDCPKCNNKMYGEGHNIPFATFMGFEGNKVPDIDLNFSGEYQGKAHNHIRDLFGQDHTLRAGTIATIADKTAFGYVRNYFEETNKIDNVKHAELMRFAKSMTGSKRTTGQHPGGIMVFPKDCDVTDFTPYNYPADDITSEWRTTHFAFEYLHDSLLKLDILGHDDPTMLKMLKDLTGINPIDIPHYDKKVMNLFSGLDSLQISSDAIMGEKTGAIGIPEFGTEFVRRMLAETKPTSFADLIRISGLSHGNNVWANNAQNLIKKGLSLSEVIACRDDIMVYLVKHGISNKDAFEIMENVRKGKNLNEQMINLMVSKKVPEWYIDSCKQIKYMFPKAHAAAYVLMAWRIAWFKINYPLEYYATLFSIKLQEHDIKTCVAGKEIVRQTLKNIQERLSNKKTASEVKQKEIDLVTTYEAYAEMLARGFEMTQISLTKSLASKFCVIDNKIVPPFTTVTGLGKVAAESIIKAREERQFISIEDLSNRTKITKTHLNELIELKVLKDLPDDNKITLF